MPIAMWYLLGSSHSLCPSQNVFCVLFVCLLLLSSVPNQLYTILNAHKNGIRREDDGFDAIWFQTKFQYAILLVQARV